MYMLILSGPNPGTMGYQESEEEAEYLAAQDTRFRPFVVS
jgi:hypothetical protein